MASDAQGGFYSFLLLIVKSEVELPMVRYFILTEWYVYVQNKTMMGE